MTKSGKRIIKIGKFNTHTTSDNLGTKVLYMCQDICGWNTLPLFHGIEIGDVRVMT